MFHQDVDNSSSSDLRRQTLAVIPARAGSKGIRNKNIRDLCGAPLLAYSIAAALQTPLVGRVIVSTDDEAIAEIARHWGAEVPFLRPAKLATDNACLSSVVYDLVNTLRREERAMITYVGVLLPTQPFRTVRTLNYLFGLLGQGHGSVVTGAPVNAGPGSYLVEDENRLVPLMDPQGPYSWNGIDSLGYFKSSGYFSGQRWGYEYESPCLHYLTDPVARHDIDEPLDLDLARRIIDEGLFKPDWRLAPAGHGHSAISVSART